MIGRGIWLESIKEKINDEKFQQEMDQMLKNEKIFDWTKSLNDTQIDAIALALRMEKEGRSKLIVTSM